MTGGKQVLLGILCGLIAGSLLVLFLVATGLAADMPVPQGKPDLEGQIPCGDNKVVFASLYKAQGLNVFRLGTPDAPPAAIVQVDGEKVTGAWAHGEDLGTLDALLAKWPTPCTLFGGEKK